MLSSENALSIKLLERRERIEELLIEIWNNLYNFMTLQFFLLFSLQMVSKMSSLGPESLLLPHRIWKVKFVGESVDDCGGGYSESIAEICDELQVSFFRYFLDLMYLGVIHNSFMQRARFLRKILKIFVTFRCI